MDSLIRPLINSMYYFSAPTVLPFLQNCSNQMDYYSGPLFLDTMENAPTINFASIPPCNQVISAISKDSALNQGGNYWALNLNLQLTKISLKTCYPKGSASSFTAAVVIITTTIIITAAAAVEPLLRCHYLHPGASYFTS